MHNYLVPIYVIYSVISVGLVVWLAHTLFRNGEVFLEDVFEDNPRLAKAVNRLLVIGFYMANLGYAALLLQSNAAADAVVAVANGRHPVERLAQRLQFDHGISISRCHRS